MVNDDCLKQHYLHQLFLGYITEQKKAFRITQPNIEIEDNKFITILLNKYSILTVN